MAPALYAWMFTRFLCQPRLTGESTLSLLSFGLSLLSGGEVCELASVRVSSVVDAVDGSSRQSGGRQYICRLTE